MLTDRFRTYFPEDYKRLYPNATSTRDRATAQSLSAEAAAFSKAKRKERTPFTSAEDANLLIGFGKYGGKWSQIQKDPELGLSNRRSTDLRDRFRNAFPDKYVGAGFKAPPAKRPRREITEEETTEQENPAATTTTYEFRTSVVPPPATTVAETTTTVTAPAVATPAQAPAAETFSHTRLTWNQPHNTRAQKDMDMEMAMKIRRALDMSNEGEMIGDTEIPLDPGLSDVAYQPHGGNADAESLTGLLDAAVQQGGSWKRT